ncbi:MAG: glycosyltransferase family 2 protein, partial [Tidjanibacter sp.]|nr:glycosyltransferase family 2 protein [Tidjanibacter sp.]
MDNQITISVIIPLYNKAASVEATLASVLAQSVQPLEIIVVDDGSTDDSAERAERFADRGVRVVRQANGGVSRARNRGAAEAQGTHLAFLDADDRWENNFIESMTAAISENPECGLYASAYRVVGADGRSGLRRAAESGVTDFFEQVKS